MNRYSLKILSAAIVGVFLECARSLCAQTVNDNDQQFMKKAAAGGMLKSIWDD